MNIHDVIIDPASTYSEVDLEAGSTEQGIRIIYKKPERKDPWVVFTSALFIFNGNQVFTDINNNEFSIPEALVQNSGIYHVVIHGYVNGKQTDEMIRLNVEKRKKGV